MRRTWIALVLLASTPALAFDLGLGPALGPPALLKNTIRYSGVAGAGESPRQENLNLSIPIFRGEQEGWTLSAAYEWLNIQPESSAPRDLYNVQFGGGYTRLLGEGRQLSANASYGSASDRPFRDSTVSTLGGTLLYSFPDGPRSRWLLLLNYSNNRPLLNNLPLPGFAYTFTPSSEFRGVFGVPFASIYWKFAERWSLTAFTLAPWVLKTSVAYSPGGPGQAFAGVDFAQETFLQYGRADSKERLYFEEKKVFTGFRSPLSAVLSAEVELGYAFGRRTFSAERYTASPADPAPVAAGAYGKLGVTAAF